MDILYKIVENDVNYTNRIIKNELLSEVERGVVTEMLIRLYGRENTYVNHLIFYMRNGKLAFRCQYPKDNIFIMANGDVFCCTKFPSLGNVCHEDIDRILFNSSHKNLLQSVGEDDCHRCFSPHGSYKTIL